MKHKGGFRLLQKINIKNFLNLLLGSAILAFGLYNIHNFAQITEGGILGLTLLLHKWFNLSPSLSGLVFNTLSYLLGWKILGNKFILKSFIASMGFSIFYFIFEQFPPIYPNIADHPLISAILGATFVGVGVGIALRSGGAPGGDDALAISVSTMTKIKIQWVYLFFDLVILLLSLTYIPINKIIYSLITVFLSGQIIGFISKSNKFSS